jgi:uncharacterized protein
MKRTGLVAVVAAGMLLVAGCGSGGGGTVTVTAQPAGPAESSPVSVKVSVTPPSSTPVSVAVSETEQSPPGSGDGESGSDGGTGASGAEGQANVTPTAAVGAYTSEEMAADVQTAIETSDGFWANHWSEFFTGSYSSPAVFGDYNGMYVSSDARFPGPTCGGEEPLADNAFYCPPEDYLAWDLVLMSDAYTLGDAFLYYVIAHEWGHAIQARLDGSLVAQAQELQADCLAAAALYGAVADELLTLEEGDEAEIANALVSVADTTPWGTTEDHGSPFERIEWFNAGRQGGVPTCLNVPQSAGT